jgi:hypothetical protein
MNKSGRDDSRWTGSPDAGQNQLGHLSTPTGGQTVAVHQMCDCGHSDAAHAETGSGCAFCDCTRFRFDHIEREFDSAHNIAPARLHADERHVSLPAVAEALGVSLRTLRRAAQKEGILALGAGQEGRIEARHVTALERRFQRRSTSLEAERTSFEDGQAQISGYGRTMTEPGLLGTAPTDPARRAEIEAMARILDPLASEHRLLPSRLPRGKHQAARLAERRALDDILKPRPAEPPERSL